MIIGALEQELFKVEADERKLTQEYILAKGPLLEQIEKIKLKILKRKFGVEPGVLVADRKGKVFKVAEVETRWGLSTKPWITGIQQLKNGSFGSAKHALYSDWTLKD